MQHNILDVCLGFSLLFLVIHITYAVQQITNPRIVEHPQDQYVARNEPATLNCKAEGDPPPVITWYRNGQPVTTSTGNPSSHRMLLPSGQLFFLRVIHTKTLKPDVGVYYCVATNPETQVSVMSRNATLEIASMRDEFRSMPSDKHVVLGETVKLVCQPPRGLPEPRVKWKKDGEVIQPSSRIIVEDEGDIIIHQAQKDDSGSYMCIAYNPAGQRESAFAKLTVLEKPQFVKKPDDITAEENSDVVFQCQAKGDPEPTIIWTREGEQVPTSRSEILADRSLKISKIRVSDQGLYVCRAENAAGFIEATAKLVVHSHPSFIVTPRDKSVGIGRRVSFRCEVTGSPPPAVFWNKVTSQVLMFPRQDNGRFSVSDDGTLTIEPVRKEDDGEYQCQALSLAGSAFAKAKLEVKDEDPRPPPIIHQGPQNQTLPLNSVALLQCTASGDPLPLVRWFKDGHPLALNEPRFTQLDSGTLQISDLKKQDTGMYTCVTSSETGETTWSAALKVEAPTSSVVFYRTPEPSTFPGPPTKPEVTDIKENSVRLRWKPNANHGASPVHSYTVEYVSHETGEGWIVASSSISELSYVVTNLRSDTRYMFLVRAQNNHGLSMPSPVTEPIRTLGERGVPKMPIYQHDLKLVAEKLSGNVIEMLQPGDITPTEIEINWKVTKSREYIEGFHVKYRIIPVDGEHASHEHQHIQYTIETVTSNTQSSYVLRNLRKNTMYEISIQPFYLTVEGQDSKPIKVSTMEDEPSAPPRAVSVRMLDNTSVIVSWLEPPPEHHNGQLKGYKVFVYGNESKFYHELRTNASVHSLLVQRLIAGMKYKLQVAAFNRRGDGKRSDFIEFGDPQFSEVSLVKQPWFIGTLAGSIGGVFWLTLCCIIIWLLAKRCTSKKMLKNGSVNVPVHKADDLSRHVTAPLLGNHQTMIDSNGYTVNGNCSRDDACYSLDRTSSLIYEKLEPTGTAFSSSHDFEMKENSLNAAELAAFAPLRTFYNKNSMPVAPYAMANVIGNIPPAESPFRPIQQSPGPQQQHLSSDEYSRNENTASNRVYENQERRGLCVECEGRISPNSDCGCATADEEGLENRHQPKLCIPPPPDHPPPSEMGSPPDSPTAPVRSFQRVTGIHMGYGSHDMRPYGTQDGRGSYGNRDMVGLHMGYSSQGDMVGFSPHIIAQQVDHRHPDSLKGRLVSPAAGTNNSLRGVHGARAFSEPEHSPSPTIQTYRLVPVTESELLRHYSDNDGVPTLHMLIPHDSPPSPTPDDPMMDRAIQSSLPSLASECQLGYEQNHYSGRMESPVSDVGAVHDYIGDSDGESAVIRHRASPRDRNMGAEVPDSITEPAVNSDDTVDSLSSSDGSLLDADADFASAVARAAQLSGLTVVGSTVMNDAARQNAKDKNRRQKRRERAKRPTSPYSTDSNYSAVVVPHKPYPKADRRRQLEQQKGGRASDKRSRPPPTKSKPSTEINGYPRQMNNGPIMLTSTNYPVTTSVVRQLGKSVSPEMNIRSNPLDAFDTADTPIV